MSPPTAITPGSGVVTATVAGWSAATVRTVLRTWYAAVTGRDTTVAGPPGGPGVIVRSIRLSLTMIGLRM